MLFRRLFLCALFVGLLTGLFDSVVQRWQVVPLILAAEVFEESAAPAAADHAHADGAAHSHDAQAWEPAQGRERTGYTVLANVLNAMGSALLLMPLLAFWNRQRAGQPLALHQGYGAAVRYGLAWGAAGWVCLFALPALGRELAGMPAKRPPFRAASTKVWAAPARPALMILQGPVHAVLSRFCKTVLNLNMIFPLITAYIGGRIGSFILAFSFCIVLTS